MLARSYRDIAYFDRTVQQLREYFNLLLQPAKAPAQHKSEQRNKGKPHA